MTRMLVREDTVVLRCGDGEVQIGTDPRWAIRLTGLSPAQEAWVHGLRPGTPPPDPDEESADLVATLSDALVLVPRHRRRGIPVRAPSDGIGDRRVLSALRPDAAGRRTLEERARRTVAISGLGRLGSGLALTLATAGVGELVLDDTRAIDPADVGPAGFSIAHVGRPRDSTVRRTIAETAPHVVTDGASTPDVIVLVEEGAARPDRTLALMSEGIAHLSVVVREADVLVGPFVVPGRTPCLRCVELHRADVDPAWPLLAGQLRAMHPLTHETVLATTGASIAAGQVLTALDGSLPRTAAACIEIPAPDAMPRLSAIAIHPSCGCGA